MTVPSSSTFSFTAPYPPTSSTSATGTIKQRRVSLALASSPKVFPAWSFRDDTGLGVHSADVEEDVKRGKMRRIDPDEPVPGDHSLLSDKPEKKPRKKWTMEETQMLVAGCNKVRRRAFLSRGGELTTRGGRCAADSGASATGNPSSTTPSSSLMDGPPSISKTGTRLLFLVICSGCPRCLCPYSCHSTLMVVELDSGADTGVCPAPFRQFLSSGLDIDLPPILSSSLPMRLIVWMVMVLMPPHVVQIPHVLS